MRPFSTLLLTLMGLAGLIVACTVIFQPFNCPDQSRSIFHEIDYRPTLLMDNLVAVNVLPQDTAGGDQSKLKQLASHRPALINRHHQDTINFARFNKVLTFDISLSTLYQWEKHFDSTFSSPVNAVIYFYRPENSDSIYSATHTFLFREPPNDIAFLMKYPGVGLWLLLYMATISFAFVAFTACVLLWLQQRRRIGFRFGGWLYWRVAATSLGALVGVAFIWQATFYDQEIVLDMYFLDRLGTVMRFLDINGYLCGGLCLGGCAYCGVLLERLRQSPFATPAKDKPNRILTMARDVGEDFNTYFLMAAAILSLMVLCSGAMYQAVNTLDFLQLLKDDWGYSPAKADFVLLYGTLHTVLLLIFYLPVKLRIGALTANTTAGTENGTNNKFKALIPNPVSRLKDVFVLASPLLSGIVQQFFDAVFSA